MDKSNAQQVTQTHIGSLFIPVSGSNSLQRLAIILHIFHARINAFSMGIYVYVKCGHCFFL